MTYTRPGDFIVALCHAGEEMAAAMHMDVTYGGALKWTIVGDARVPSANVFLINQSHVQRRCWDGMYTRPTSKDLYKASMFTRAMKPNA